MKNENSVVTLINPKISLPSNSLRIVSLVPSQTELLHYLGLEEEVVGITKFCIHPKVWHQNKARIGGTKTYKMKIIDELKPTLILGNKEENERVGVLALAEKYPVYISDIQTLEDAYQMIIEVGRLVEREDKANQLVKELQERFDELSTLQPRIKAAYFIWRKPFMVAASGTFIHEMMEVAGFENIFKNKERYPSIELTDLSEADPQVILLSSEPYPFKEKHLKEFEKTCPEAQIILVDGELFSWYGNRLLASVSYFQKLRTEIMDTFFYDE